MRVWRVLISFNNNEIFSSFSPVNVGLRFNHINRCVLFFSFFLFFYLYYYYFCRDLYNKLVSERGLKISRRVKDYRAHKTKINGILVEGEVDCSLVVT